MSNSIPLTFRSAPFPDGYKAGPEEFKNDLVARLYAESTDTISFFAAGSIAPTSNVGPWLNNGITWYVWSDSLGMYVPQVMESASLGYIASAVAPDPDVYTFWIELNGSGKAISINYYYSGTWHDVYEDRYQTIAGMSSYSTTTDMNAAIAAAVAGIPSSSSYPGKGVTDMGGQSVLINSTPQKVNLMVAVINPDPSPWDITNRRYIAPVDGIYAVDCSTQFDNVTGTASGMQVEIELYKNGAFVGEAMADLDNTPSPSGDRWSPGFGGLVSLAQNDYIELFVTADDGVNTGLLSLTVAQMSVNRVS